MRGEGRLYRPKISGRECKVWWLDVGARGQRFRLSTKTRDYDEAVIVLGETKRRLKALFSCNGKGTHD